MELKSLGKFFKIWYPSILMMVLIFIMSSFPAVDSDQQSGLIVNALTTAFPSLENVDFLVNIVRKSAHFLEYAIFGFFTARAFKLSKKSPWFAILLCGIYAATDEYHQTFVPGRSGEIADILLDTAGATFGATIYILTHRKK
ncbi:VanZ family protein [Candidatus Saccharibacteria bacterium]|nr:VanZ family protein [Candidatus Saccharibacteria bacterium]